MDPARAASIPLLAVLDRHGLEQVLRTAREQTYAPGEAVVNEGDPATRLYLIVDGTATAEQHGQTVGRIETGEFFGELALIEEHGRTATVAAESELDLPGHPGLGVQGAAGRASADGDPDAARDHHPHASARAPRGKRVTTAGAQPTSTAIGIPVRSTSRRRSRTCCARSASSRRRSAFTDQANINDASIYDRAATEEGFRAFWTEEAKRIDWIEPWTELLDWQMPYAKWFVGGKLNISVNCLDRHVANGLGDKVAYYWEGEPGDTRTLTYQDLLDETCRMANALRGLGVKKGDRVAIYMPMIPELPGRHAGLRPDRRAAQRRLRRLQRRCAGRAHRGRASARRSSPPTAAIARAPPCR